jgi:hypothetical protein
MLLFKNRGSLHYNNSKKFSSSIVNNFSGPNKKCNSVLKEGVLNPSLIKTMRKNNSNKPQILKYESPGSKTVTSIRTLSLKFPTLVSFRKKNYTKVDFIPKKEDVDDLDKNRDMDTDEENEETEEDYYDGEADEEEDEDIILEYVSTSIGPTTIKELNVLLIENNLTIIFFYTFWSKYSEILDVYWKKLISEKKPKLTFIKVNNDYSEEIVNKYDVKYIPTFLIIKRTSETKIEIIANLSGVRIKELKSIISENSD